MIRSAWPARRSACSTTRRFAATRDRLGRRAPDDAAVAAGAWTRRVRRRTPAYRRSDRAHREVGRERRASGNPADVPKPPTFSGGWQLGTPDLVLTLPEPYALQPGSRDVFRNFVVPVPITTRRMCAPSSSAPIARRALHHADLAIDLGRVSRVLDRADRSRIRDDGRRSGLQRMAGRPARFR